LLGALDVVEQDPRKSSLTLMRMTAVKSGIFTDAKQENTALI